MSEHVFLNGQILPAPEARISVFDAGFTHAAGLFETMRAYNGRVLRAEAHLDRLLASATALGLHMPAAVEAQIPSSRDEFAKAIYAVLEANDLRDARVRLTVTPGDIPRPGVSLDHRPPPTVLVTAGPVQPYPPQLYRTGMRVSICPYKQNRHDPLAGHKTLAYLPRLLAMKDAADRQCNESLWFNTENRLAEGSICNVFIVKEGALMTPKRDTPVLPGIVRAAVMELAGANGISCEEVDIDIETLLSAQEVFLTGSVLEVMPVTSIEKHMVGDGAVGEMTQRVSDLYRKLVAAECGTDG